jgi:hypothetical protein
MTTNPKYLIARFQKIGNVQKKTTTDMGMIVETTYSYLKERLIVKEVAGVIEMVTYIVPGSTEVWCL